MVIENKAIGVASARISFPNFQKAGGGCIRLTESAADTKKPAFLARACQLVATKESRFAVFPVGTSRGLVALGLCFAFLACFAPFIA